MLAWENWTCLTIHSFQALVIRKKQHYSWKRGSENSCEAIPGLTFLFLLFLELRPKDNWSMSSLLACPKRCQDGKVADGPSVALRGNKDWPSAGLFSYPLLARMPLPLVTQLFLGVNLLWQEGNSQTGDMLLDLDTLWIHHLISQYISYFVDPPRRCQAVREKELSSSYNVWSTVRNPELQNK